MPFPKTGGEKSDELLGIVHSNACGKIEKKSLSGAEYFKPSSMISQDSFGLIR